uniref:Uncharacterized protein n=1 Tax=Avena sativa TaxID=4498 RepID=A0ACD5XWV5_AVESA
MDIMNDSLTLLPVAVALLPLVLLLLLKRLRFGRLPPGPRPWPVVGNLFHIEPVQCRCFLEWARRYGPIMTVWFGSQPTVVVSTPELAREVLKTHDAQLAGRLRTRSADRFSHGGQDIIWADYGPHYVKVRRLCNQELFAPRRLEGLRPIREDEVTAMVQSVHAGATGDRRGKAMAVRDHLSKVGFNNITRTAFGKRFVDATTGELDEQGREFKGIVANGIKIGASLSLAEHVPWLRWLFPLDEELYSAHNDRRDRLTVRIMEEQQGQAQAQEAGGTAKQHFVHALFTLREQYSLSDDTVIGLLWDMVTAGMDTTVISVEFAMAELVSNPSVQEKAQEELDRVVGRDRVMSETDIPNLPYLQAVVKESIRLHPPTPLLVPHRASAAVKIAGYDIPKGATVAVNVWAIARDPTVWDSPLQFRPERFLHESIDIKGCDYRVLPFGAGRRMCPGAQLGINLVTSVIGHLLHHFTWALPQGTQPKDVDMMESPGIVAFMATPLHAVATPRLQKEDLYERVPVEM